MDKKILIGIYDRYLNTAGGGERYSCKMAEILSHQKNYRVELVTDLFTNLKRVSAKLNIDLDAVNLKVFPFLSDEYAGKITKAYDIFINATYLSSLSANAKRNLYLCYFPTPFDVDFKMLHRFLLKFFRIPALWLYKFADRISDGFKDIEVVEGIYDVKRFYLKRGAWSSGKTLIIYRNLSRKNSRIKNLYKKKSGFSIRIGLKNPKASSLSIVNCIVRIYEKENKKIIYTEHLMIPKGCKKFLEFKPHIDDGKRISKSDNTEYIVEIESDTFFPEIEEGRVKDSRKLGIVLYDEQRTNFIEKIILKLVGFVPLFLVTFPQNLKFLDSYDEIIAISKYSQKWIKKLWSKDSIILYPPVDVEKLKPKAKEKIILSVGRFFSEHHNKKQYELAQNFIELFENYKDIMADFKLYLVGGVEEKPAHLEYLERIKEISKGYPVKIIPNIEWSDLVELFSKSFIFWHAAGMGEDTDRHPEKFEHFGITTVEAMASGCIPVVINMGGQTEIIRDGYNGFLFESWEQLREITLKICKNEIDCATISRNALNDAKRFSSKNFEKRLLDIIGKEVSRL